MNKKTIIRWLVFVLISLPILLTMGCGVEEDYEKIVSSFTPITISEAQANIEDGTPFILYFSRQSCSFCSEVIKNVGSAAREKGVEIHYIDTDDSQLEDDENYLQFRNDYDIEFDPAMLLFTQDDWSEARLITDTDEIALIFKRYLEDIEG